MKFIIIQQPISSDGDEMLSSLFPVIFPNAFVHASVFDALKPMLQEMHNLSEKDTNELKVISAGYINIEPKKTYGESTTLNITHHLLDKVVLSNIDYISIFNNDSLKEIFK